jgi:diaminohydroxyphosphoribosylaminopyrimidine deaminase/5-amino-6-(5-phosphoribosylamino)uracil reductase
MIIASPMQPNLHDLHFMAYALRLAARHQGRTMPNPSVGCVIVKDAQVLAAAVTAEGGRPHAETEALASIGEKAQSATAYVSLEPCAHHGKTPPCAEALINAGIARVVIGARDPDPRVAGKGIAMLQAAGVELVNLDLPEARSFYRGFFRRLQHGLPEIWLKLALSSDGAMQDGSGRETTITGILARRHSHILRGMVDAVVTGIGTVLADDPALTCRLAGYEHPRLMRVVADRHLRLPLTSQLVKTAAQQPVVVVTLAEAIEAQASHAIELREAGVTLLVEEEMTPWNIARALSKLGVMRMLVEAGPTLSTAFLKAGAVDRLYRYVAPLTLGRAEAALMAELEKTPRQKPAEWLHLGADFCEEVELNPCLPD